MAGAFFAGIGRGLYAYYITYIDPSSFTKMESISILVMVIFRGIGKFIRLRSRCSNSCDIP